MNWRELRKLPWPIRNAGLVRMLWRGALHFVLIHLPTAVICTTSKPRNVSGRMSGVRAEIRTGHLLDKSKSPVTCRGGLWGCEVLRILLCLDNWLTVSGEVVCLTHWQRSTPQKHLLFLLYSFLFVAE
jgi:hypothetical protein